jgi:hypothetical protein
VASRHATHHHHVSRATLQWSLGVRVETEACALLVARKLPRLSAFLGTLQLPPATLIQVSSSCCCCFCKTYREHT